MVFLGYDIGSSSVKVSLLDADSGKIIASNFYPKEEMPIIAKEQGWAEQHPEDWWKNLVKAHHSVMQKANICSSLVSGIGITWQMHGLVLVDQSQKVLRPAIIWCDSRAVDYGNRAFKDLGEEYCLNHLLNSPGNFTASKLAWVKEHEPKIFDKVDKLMLPGDYIAMKLSNDISTTIEGLSEGIFWDFKNQTISNKVLDYFGIPESFIPKLVPTFGKQAELSKEAAIELNLKEGTPITYRAGDQPNNAFSLNVMNTGEIAANAGTSGVVYGISDQLTHDTRSRVNIFAHVNHTNEQNRLGVLLCINGTGILNSWARKNLTNSSLTYAEMNELASESPIGAKGLSITPFGNGAERILANKESTCSIHGINFNTHDQRDLLRATQEGIVFSYQYGMEIMQSMGMSINVIRAGYANMFLSPVFSQTLANINGATIELYDTDGATGAAKGAGIGLGYYQSHKDAFASIQKIKTIEPQGQNEQEQTWDAYQNWRRFI